MPRMTSPGSPLSRLLLAAALVWGLASLWGSPVGEAVVLETDRLWTIGVSAFEDGLYDQAYRMLGRFIEAAEPGDVRRGDASVLRGKAALAMGQYALALVEFQAAEEYPTRAIPAGEPIFWQAEVFFRLNRFYDARDLYGRFLVVSPDSTYATDALYGRGLCELQTEH